MGDFLARESLTIHPDQKQQENTRLQGSWLGDQKQKNRVKNMAERPEDLNLPGSIVSRIIKDALPDGTKVSKEASQAIAKAASVFVLYATSCSNQIASRANRKTIGGQDVISAMEDMDFDKFIRPLEVNLEGWKESQQKKKDARRKPGEDKKKDDPSAPGDQEDKENQEEEDDEVQEIPS